MPSSLPPKHARRCRYPKEGSQRIEHRRDRILGPRERGAERIADRFEDIAVMRGDRFPHERVVTTYGRFHRRAIPIPTLRRALNIGEDERNRAARYAN